MRTSFLFVISVFAFFACRQNEKPSSSPLSVDEYMSYLSAISHDSTEGRAPGSRGYDKAALYGANLFKKWGLQPAGDNGTYFQAIHFVEATKDETSFKGFVTTAKGKIKLDPAENFTLRPLTARKDTNVKGVPIVFAGYGIDAPELGYNSYEGLDVKGKIVLVSGGAPSSFNNEAAAIYAFNKAPMALAHGAAGVMMFFPFNMNRSFAFIKLNSMYALGWQHSDGTNSDNNPDLEISSRISGELATELLTLAGIDAKTIDGVLKDGQMIHAEIPATLTASIRYHQKSFNSPNIVAMLPGHDEKLKDEIVVMTAHLDHLGIRPVNKSDTIYNGTVDNASGSAALLTLARRLSEENKAARTVVFVLLNGEELGLLGSNYFAKYPTVPKEKIVANMNMDGILGLIIGTKDFIPYGYEYSNLSGSVDAALAKAGGRKGVDKRPQEGFFVRSDQFSFVKEGIPAIWITGGYEATDSTKDALKIHEQWDNERYHQPNDDLQQPIDKDGLLSELTVQYQLIEDILNRKDKIQWVEGSYLWKKYGVKNLE